MKTNKFKFHFRKAKAYIMFFKRHSNLFLVFLDSRQRHISTLTSGSCGLGRNKKQKLAPLNMGGIIQRLKTYLEKYKVKYLILLLRQRIAFYFHNLRKLFRLHNIRIIGFRYILRRPHGFKRGRTPRRV